MGSTCQIKKAFARTHYPNPHKGVCGLKLITHIDKYIIPNDWKRKLPLCQLLGSKHLIHESRCHSLTPHSWPADQIHGIWQRSRSPRLSWPDAGRKQANHRLLFGLRGFGHRGIWESQGHVGWWRFLSIFISIALFYYLIIFHFILLFRTDFNFWLW